MTTTNQNDFIWHNVGQTMNSVALACHEIIRCVVKTSSDYFANLNILRRCVWLMTWDALWLRVSYLEQLRCNSIDNKDKMQRWLQRQVHSRDSSVRPKYYKTNSSPIIGRLEETLERTLKYSKIKQRKFPVTLTLIHHKHNITGHKAQNCKCLTWSDLPSCITSLTTQSASSHLGLTLFPCRPGHQTTGCGTLERNVTRRKSTIYCCCILKNTFAIFWECGVSLFNIRGSTETQMASG